MRAAPESEQSGVEDDTTFSSQSLKGDVPTGRNASTGGIQGNEKWMDYPLFCLHCQHGRRPRCLNRLAYSKSQGLVLLVCIPLISVTLSWKGNLLIMATKVNRQTVDLSSYPD